MKTAPRATESLKPSGHQVAAFSAMASLELHERKTGFGEFGPQGLPIATVFTLSLFVANGVTKIQTVGVSAIIFCYCVDMEVNDGSDERPYSSPPELIDKMNEIRMDMRRKKNGDGLFVCFDAHRFD